MTIEDAIKNRENCLEYLEKCGPLATKENVQAVRLSLEALREKAEREKTEPLTREKMAEILEGFQKGDYIEGRLESVVSTLISNGVTVNGVENGTVETVTDCNGLKPKTNLDHVRTLPGEELARCMSDWQDWGGGLDPKDWLEWLQAPWDEKTWQKKFFL